MTAHDWLDKWSPTIIALMIAFVILLCMLVISPLAPVTPERVNESVAVLRNCTNGTCVVV